MLDIITIAKLLPTYTNETPALRQGLILKVLFSFLQYS